MDADAWGTLRHDTPRNRPNRPAEWPVVCEDAIRNYDAQENVMGAFDMLFRNNRRPMMSMRRPQGGFGKIGLVGLAGLGYAAYRFLKTERGREVQSTVVDQVRNFGGRLRTQANGSNAQL